MAPILAAALSPDEAGLVHWVTKLGGEVIGSDFAERMLDRGTTAILCCVPTTVTAGVLGRAVAVKEVRPVDRKSVV